MAHTKRTELERMRLIGLGEHSIQKSYYPELRKKLAQLERFRTLLDQTNDAIFMAVADSTTIVDCNQAAARLLGLEPETLVGSVFTDYLRPDDLSRFNMLLRQCKSACSTGILLAPLERHDGHTHPLEMTVHFHTLEGTTYAIIVGRDVTERLVAQRELERLQSLLTSIVNSMPSILVAVDADGIVIQWNQEAQRATGVPQERAMGRPLPSVFPDLASRMAAIQASIRDKLPYVDHRVAWGSNGDMRLLDITVYPLLSGIIEGAVIRIDDVTERTRLEEMMVQSEKMLSVGGLAAGMAHEINNPLASVLQSAQVMTNRLTSDLHKNNEVAAACGTDIRAIEAYAQARGIFRMIDGIVDSGRRAAKIVANMLNFSRKGDSKRAPHNLAALLDETVEIAYHDYDLKKKYDFRRIDIVREYDDALPDVMCEGGLIQQVFFNILSNGAHAMADMYREDTGWRPRLTLRAIATRDAVRIEIEDNGPGMLEDVRKRAFEPFFTTKGVGVGTGLGLSVSYFIITENHCGTLSVESAPGRGSTFIIELPVRDTKACKPTLGCGI